MKSRWIFSLSLVLLISCSPQTYEALANGEQELSFEWVAMGCYGKCPQYAALIENGQLRFIGSVNTKFIGDTLIADFEDTERALIEKLTQIDFLALDSIYSLGGSTYDGPSYRYNLSTRASSTGGYFIGQKSVLTYGAEPDSLNSLSKWLNQQLVEAGLL